MREGGLALVRHTGFADSAIGEIIALAGFDGVFIDMAHTGFDLQLVGEMIRIADLTGITPIWSICSAAHMTVDRGVASWLMA